MFIRLSPESSNRAPSTEYGTKGSSEQRRGHPEGGGNKDTTP